MKTARASRRRIVVQAEGAASVEATSTASPLGFYDVTCGDTRFVLHCFYQEAWGHFVQPMVWQDQDQMVFRLKEYETFLLWIGESPERFLDIACHYLASYCGAQASPLMRRDAPRIGLSVMDIRDVARDASDQIRRGRRTRGADTEQARRRRAKRRARERLE